MFKKFITAVVVALPLIAGTAMAGKERVRLAVPISNSYDSVEIVTLFGGTIEEESATGFGLNYIFDSGIGLGYSSTDATLKYSYTLLSSTYKSTTNTSAQFLDVSYMFGETFTFQVGYGFAVGWSGTEKSETGSTTTEEKLDVGGNALSFVLGYAFGSLDIGYEIRREVHDLAYETNTQYNGGIGMTVSRLNLGYVF